MAEETLDLVGFKSEDDLEGYKQLKPGNYHVVISEADPAPTNKDGKPIDGIKCVFEVVAGTVPNQEEQTLNQIFNRPSPHHKDGGDFCRRVLGRLALVTGLIGKDSLNKRVGIDWSKLKFKQLIIAVGEEKDDRGNLWPRLSMKGETLGMLSLDDERGKAVPRSQEALGLLKATPAAGVGGAVNGNGGASHAAATTSDDYAKMGL